MKNSKVSSSQYLERLNRPSNKEIDLSKAHPLRGGGDSLPLTWTIRLREAGSTPTADKLATSVGGCTLWAFCDGNQTHFLKRTEHRMAPSGADCIICLRPADGSNST